MKFKTKFDNQKIVFSYKKRLISIFYGDLMYIKYEKPICWLHLKGKVKYWIEISVTSLIENLPEDAFLICKRSVIVNLLYFKYLYENLLKIEMVDGATFDLSKENIRDLKWRLERLPAISPPCPICYPCKEKCERQALLCRKIINEHNDD